MANYGLTYSDIVNAFSGTLVTDFAVGAVDGATIINNEIELQTLILNDLLSDNITALANKVDLEIATISVSGSLNLFTPGLYAQTGTLQAWTIYKDALPCSVKDFYGSCGLFWSETSLSFGTVANFTSIGNNVYQLDSIIDKNKQYLVLTYFVDETLSDFGSLKTILRNMVAASLGSRLFPSGSDTWNIVQYYKEQSEKYLKMMEDGKFNSTLGLNLLFKRGGLKSIPVNRA